MHRDEHDASRKIPVVKNEFRPVPDFPGVDAPVNWFLKAVNLCYERPDAAILQMRKYFAIRGQSAFLRKLAVKPGYFGRFPSTEGNPPQRREIRQATAILPLLAKDALTENETTAARKTLASAHERELFETV